jgi:hypothetical protein
MLQNDNFTMRADPQWRQKLQELARHFQRTESDTIRVLVSGAFNALREQEQKDPEPAQQVPAN